MGHDGFISYSHSADGRLAPALQAGLQRLARPWYRRRALDVFRDDTGLSANPQLWSSIQTALDGSRYFLWLASPESAQSPWVGRELRHWMDTKTAASLRILPVLTDGELVWDDTIGDYDPVRSTALPAALAGAFPEEPRHVDLRWARDEQHLDLRHSRFREAVADLAAPMHGMSKDELEGEDIRRHKRAMRLATAVGAGLLLVTIAAIVASVFAVRYASTARANERRAVVAQRAAHRNATRAQHNATTARANADRARLNESEAKRQQSLASRNEQHATQNATIAATNATEAAHQRDRAAASAADALTQKNLADQNAAEAEAQQAIADQNAQDARTQQALATRNADEARAQQALAVQNFQSALSRQLAAVSLNPNVYTQDPTTGLLLATEAYRVADTVEARDALMRKLQATGAFGAPPLFDKVTLAGLTGTTTTSATVSSDASVVAVARAPDGDVSLFDTATGSLLGRRSGTGTAITQLDIASDDRTVALQGDGTVVLWNASSGVEHVLAAPPGTAAGVAFDATGTLLATTSTTDPSGATGGSLLLWDGTSGAPRPSPPVGALSGTLSDVQFSAFDAVAVRTDGGIQFTNPTTGELGAVVPAGGVLPGARVVTFVGRLLAVGLIAHGDSLRIWDLTSGTLVRDIGFFLGGHMTLAPSHDDRFVATFGGPEGYALDDFQVFATPSITPVGQFTFVDRPFAASFGTDDRTLVWVDASDSLTAMSFDAEQWAAVACTSAGRDLTAEERLQYLGDAAATAPAACPTPSS